ncbi:MAG: hypothetical protein A2020_00330 [Lentisphaerae bacterium GWF2_45_14]|nr:MAG: hypothetical protein A2020_00330 [Lentisphaerae bacterium GWF2_45_14]
MIGFPNKRLISFYYLALLFITSFTLGSFLDTIRFKVMSIVISEEKLPVVPRITKFILELPSNDLFPKYSFFLQIFLIPSILFAVSNSKFLCSSVDNESKRMNFTVNSLSVIILNIIFFIFLIYWMICPLIPYLEILPPPVRNSSSISIIINWIFWIGIIVWGVSMILGVRVSCRKHNINKKNVAE